MPFRRSIAVFPCLLLVVLLAALAAGCRKTPAIDTPTPQAPEPMREAPEPASPPERVPDDAGDYREREPVERPVTEGDLADMIRRGLSPVYFDYDRHDLTEATLATLKANAGALRANPSWQVRIEGHCDDRGTIEYNLELGAKRARAVMEYLVSLGIPADRLETRSYGEERPVQTGHEESSWSKNRRAEFVAAGS